MATTIDPMATTGTATQYLLSTYYDKRLLDRLVPVPCFYQHGQKKPLPKGEGKVVKWSRFVNLGNAALLTEGTRPTSLVLSTVNVTGTLIQCGGYSAVSDFVEMTAISSIVEGAVDVFATQAGQSMDQYIVSKLLGGVGYGATLASMSCWNRRGGVTRGSCSTLSAFTTLLRAATFGFDGELCNKLSATCSAAAAFGAKKISGFVTCLTAANCSSYAGRLQVQDIREAVTELKKANVPPMDDGYYIGFVHPIVAAGIRKDSEWQNWNQYSGELAKTTMYKGEIGEVERVRFVESTLTYGGATTKGSLLSCFVTTIVGKDAYGVVEMEGGVKTYVKAGNSYDSSNPLNQWTTIGWKVTMACSILEAARGFHIVTFNYQA